jgi:hypothetical protein
LGSGIYHAVKTRVPSPALQLSNLWLKGWGWGSTFESGRNECLIKPCKKVPFEAYQKLKNEKEIHLL